MSDRVDNDSGQRHLPINLMTGHRHSLVVDAVDAFLVLCHGDGVLCHVSLI